MALVELLHREETSVRGDSAYVGKDAALKGQVLVSRNCWKKMVVKVLGIETITIEELRI